MKTLLTIKEQNDFLNTHGRLKTLTHKWSSRGYGNSKILDSRGDVIGKAGGCGYDRYGAAIGNAISNMFPELLAKLAKRVCKGKRRNYKGSEQYYGLFYDANTETASLDGGCGHTCMTKILNKIGFSLEYVGESSKSDNGEVFYTLAPLSKHERQYH